MPSTKPRNTYGGPAAPPHGHEFVHEPALEHVLRLEFAPVDPAYGIDVLEFLEIFYFLNYSNLGMDMFTMFML